MAAFTGFLFFRVSRVKTRSSVVSPDRCDYHLTIVCNEPALASHDANTFSVFTFTCIGFGPAVRSVSFASLLTRSDYAIKAAVKCQGLAKENYARVCLPRSMVSSVGEPSPLAFNMVANVSTSLQSSLTATATVVAASAGQNDSIISAVGHVLYLTMRIIPSVVVWLAAFATFTLPAWVYTTFSMSLTFTMNVTTLYAEPGSRLFCRELT